MNETLIDNLSPDQPVLLAGPTASGKSAIALAVAQAQGRTIVNADALQVYDCWQLLSARPSAAETTAADHALYGHLPFDAVYSAGHWLRQVTPFLAQSPAPVIVGGTGLYFLALTEGLAEIPATNPDMRREASTFLEQAGLAAMVAEIDEDTGQRIDLKNPMRVQRAFEVLRQTGRGLADWQNDTPPPLVPVDSAACWQIDVQTDWLNERIDRRFDMMMAQGAIDEVQAILDHWDPALPSSKAIGAPELVAFLRGEITESEAVARAKIASHQYAKRQRTWLRRRMGSWHKIDPQKANF